MIKKLLVCSITFLSVGLFYGQNIEADSRLEVKYTKAELQQLKEGNQEELKFLNFCIDNAFVIDEIPVGKLDSPEILGKINLKRTDNVNFFDLGISIHEKERSYYLVENTYKVLMVYSEEEIKQKLKTKN